MKSARHNRYLISDIPVIKKRDNSVRVISVFPLSGDSVMLPVFAHSLKKNAQLTHGCRMVVVVRTRFNENYGTYFLMCGTN